MADLTTLANAKQWLNLSVTTDDALLARLITSASTFIENWLNQPILSATYTDTFNGKANTKRAAIGYPITAVQSVTIDGQVIPAATSATTPGFLFSKELIHLRGYQFTNGVQNCTITYTAGAFTIPNDVEQACIELVALRYKSRDRIGIDSRGMAGETTTYSSVDMSDSVRSSLRNYVRQIPV